MIHYSVKHQQNVLEEKYASKSITVEIAAWRFFLWVTFMRGKTHLVDVTTHVFVEVWLLKWLYLKSLSVTSGLHKQPTKGFPHLPSTERHTVHV